MKTKKAILMLAVLVVLAAVPVLSFAQDTAAPSFTPGQLDKLVAPIALYPDSLLAQVLAGATYFDQIPDAARWADQHHYLTGQALADAIQADHLLWDPSVQALLPFPSVLGDDGQRHELDHRSRQRISVAAAGRDGCSAGNAPASASSRQS